MKKNGSILALLIIISVLAAAAGPAQAVVAQNAGSAIRGDNFVGSSSSGSQKKISKKQKIKAQKKESERAKVDAAGGQLFKHDDNHGAADSRFDKNDEADDEEDNRPLVDINKHYASRLFSTLSGHITIEQNDIPRKIAVTAGSEIQLNLENEADKKWFFNLDDKIAKIKSEKVENGRKIVVIKTIGKGRTRMILDYLSTANANYKLLTSKRMLIMVK